MNQLVRAALLASLTLLSTTAFAMLEDSDDLHSFYLNGIPNDEGRYIKVGLSLGALGSLSVVTCLGNGYAGGVDSDDAEEAVGNTLQLGFSICSDAAGTSCTQVSTDTVYFQKSPAGVTAFPKQHHVNLASAASNYPSCTPEL